MFEDEVKELLAELVAHAGALDAAILHREDDAEASDFTQPPEGGEARTTPLGSGARLWVRFSSRADRDEFDRQAALERGARALRACARLWEKPLPSLATTTPKPFRQRVVSRIETFLRALATTQQADNAVLLLRGEPIAVAVTMTELQRNRIPFLIRRVSAEQERNRGESSHAELAEEDVFAVSFWVGACLISFFSGVYSVDFARHRTRLVTRELANLLPELDVPPKDPAAVAPIPE